MLLLLLLLLCTCSVSLLDMTSSLNAECIERDYALHDMT
jgi:hypothetical protein